MEQWDLGFLWGAWTRVRHLVDMHCNHATITIPCMHFLFPIRFIVLMGWYYWITKFNYILLSDHCFTTQDKLEIYPVEFLLVEHVDGYMRPLSIIITMLSGCWFQNNIREYKRGKGLIRVTTLRKHSKRFEQRDFINTIPYLDSKLYLDF